MSYNKIDASPLSRTGPVDPDQVLRDAFKTASRERMEVAPQFRIPGDYALALRLLANQAGISEGEYQRRLICQHLLAAFPDLVTKLDD